MNSKQQELVDFLHDNILFHDGLGQGYVEGWEYKKFEVKQTYGSTVSIYSVVGRKNDENTLASIFCRTTRHIFITHKGKVTLANAKDMRGKAGSYTSKKVWPKGTWHAIHDITC